MTISPSSTSYSTVGIIGAGKLGSMLVSVLGSRVAWIMCHSETKAQQLRAIFENIPVYSSLSEVRTLAGTIFLTVPDRSIKEVAEELSHYIRDKSSITTVIHCSGALGLDELVSCRAEGMRTVAAHPFQTFTGNDICAFQGIAWGIECEPEDEEFIQVIVRELGGIPIILSAKTRAVKAIYHASAVVASNFVTMLIEVAREFANEAGITELFLSPIIRRAVENSLEALHLNAPPPLTGPIVRVDIPTLERHRTALEDTPLWELYSLLSRATATIAFRNTLISENEYEMVKNIVNE